LSAAQERGRSAAGYQVQSVPGLLQTRDYARSVICIGNRHAPDSNGGADCVEVGEAAEAVAVRDTTDSGHTAAPFPNLTHPALREYLQHQKAALGQKPPALVANSFNIAYNQGQST
jgi:hypothetical protein